MIRRLRAAAAFLTALPLPGGPADAAEMARGLPFFPLVGVLLGLISGLVAWMVSPHLGPLVGAVMALFTEVLLTRGLHWDGLLDTIDGLLAHPREKSLAAMRDPRVGGGAVIGGGVFLLLFAAAVARIPESSLLLTLAAAAGVGRSAVAIAVAFFPYARAQGLGAAFRGQGGAGLLGGAIVLVALVAVFGTRGAIAALLSATLTLFGGRYAVRRFGGCSGDVYGAIEVVTEIAVLVSLGWR